MKVLIVGSGGREHALCWKIKQSAKVSRIYAAPGNAGTAACSENVAIQADDIAGLKGFALEKGIDLTVVGPEASLTLGVVDAFASAGLNIFGPSKRAAEIEASKVFSKGLMFRHKIPTAAYEGFDEAEKALKYIEAKGPPFVVKADGLAAGKGVVVCATKAEAESAIDAIMNKKAFGSAGGRIVIEEFLEGEEASFLAITDGKTVIPLAPAQDHKRIFDGDLGPNTGGMGTYSPAPIVTPALEKEVMETIMLPVVHAMEAEGRPYRGVLYAGLMIKDGKAKVLEFNARFGDPEVQPILMRMEGDLFEVLYRAATNGLDGVKIRWSKRASVCVVMAAKGYPGDYAKGKAITGLEEAKDVKDVVVFHAGTALKDGRVVTSGGRVLGVAALGDTVKAAIDAAYSAVERIKWDGAYYRRDIGKRALQ